MSTSMDDLRSEIVDSGTPLSECEELTLLKQQLARYEARDKTLVTTYIEIRNRRAQFSSPDKWAEFVRKRIRELEQILAAKQGKTARNYVSFS